MSVTPTNQELQASSPVTPRKTEKPRYHHLQLEGDETARQLFPNHVEARTESSDQAVSSTAIAHFQNSNSEKIHLQAEAKDFA